VPEGPTKTLPKSSILLECIFIQSHKSFSYNSMGGIQDVHIPTAIDSTPLPSSPQHT